MTSIQNNFIPHLYKIIQQEKCQGINDFCKFAFKEGKELFYFEKNNVSFKISLLGNSLHLLDEIEKIEVEVPIDNKGALQDLIKRYIIKKQKQIGQKTIEQLLVDEFTALGGFSTLLGKPYIVYDIETSLIGSRLEDVEFYIGYSMEESADGKMTYTCITLETLPAFVEKMLAFEGYIVGFNQMYFDNPVCIYNVSMDAAATLAAIKTLNEKSIDLYVFISQLTNTRIGLNKICEALIGVSKNLEGGGASVENLRKEWKTAGDTKIFKKIQDYCKNDVRMTALLFFYFLHFKKLYMNSEEYLFDLPKFLTYAKPLEKKIDPHKMYGQSLLS
ncbi:MAG: ribonuclease H-like domain-containing protein [Candidatus Peribacteria bacterium]|nr:ribonuclease H-like domain-containing protein [Candidatus Peribacteria bacterium]